MKRCLSMLLLLVMLITTLAVQAEELPVVQDAEMPESVETVVAEEAPEKEKTQAEIDLENLTKEPWQGQDDHAKDGLVFLPDGTGTYTVNGKENPMQWEYKEDERKAVVTYQKYTAQTVEFDLRTSKDTIVEDGPEDPQLYSRSDYTRFLQKSVTKRRADEAAEAARIALEEARSKTYKLQWNETIELDFVNISLKKAKIYRSPEQAYNSNTWQYDVKKGKQYFMLIGTVKNLTDQSLWLSDIFAAVTIDGKEYKMDGTAVQKGRQYRSSTLESKASGTFMLIAELPEKVIKNMKSAVVEFSFRNGMRNSTNTFADGDYFFRIDVGAKHVKAARKADAKKKVYILVNDKKTKLLAPASFVDVTQGGRSWSEEKFNIPVSNQKYVYNSYSYYSRFPDVKAETVMKSYIKSLNKNGYDVVKLKESEVHRWYRDKKTTYYKITLEKKLVG